MSTEITHTDLATQMEYSKVIAQSDLLPVAYRGKPANVLLAVGLGEAMGLAPAEALSRIDVIQGKPTASAELIAANVRKAGHTLRLEVNENPPAARCTIIRADDPEHEHVVVRNEDWAKRMGLLTKDNYKKQPATMLGWRAITACARQACSEALYGVGHTADELRDNPRASAQTVTAADFAPAVTVNTETGEIADEPDDFDVQEQQS